MRRLVAGILMLVVLAGLLGGCGIITREQPRSDLRALAATEIQDYQGKDLSSILDFRENSIKGNQYIDIEKYRLKISGFVDRAQSYTYDEVLSHLLYTKLVRLNCVEGWSVDILWEGVLLQELFDEAGVQADAVTVIFHAVDGYTTSMPLQTVLDREMIIAYKMNGVVLPPERGFPFQVVAEDKLGYKWAKWITEIELSDDPDYLGYWESRGYKNEADV